MLGKKITSLENEITKNKNEDNEIENQEDQILPPLTKDNPIIVVDKEVIPNELRKFLGDTSIDYLPVVYFLPFAEVGTESDEKLQKALIFGSKYNVIPINPTDYSINSQNFVEKFLFYYNQGARLFVSKSWSSILSVLNEFFNNIEKTNPEVDMESFIYLDIGSTAPNLINKDGTIASRNKYITRMIPNSIVSGEIILRKFDEEISKFDECVIIYLNDPYGSYFGNLLKNKCEEDNVPHKIFNYVRGDNSGLLEGVGYLNNSIKNILAINILFTDDIITLFKNISSPFVKEGKLKLIFTETVEFTQDIINDPDILIKYNKYDSEFYQYVGANSSISYIKNNLNVNLEGSTNTYTMIDALNLLGSTRNLMFNNSNKNNSMYNTLYSIINNYYGFTGNTQIDPNTNDRDTMMYNFTFLKINTILDDDPRNDPFPYIISSMYQEDNRLIRISDKDTNEDVEETFKSGIFLFSNFFVMNMLMSPKHIQRNSTISSTYGLGNITKVQNITIENETEDDDLGQLNLTFGEIQDNSGKGPGIGSSSDLGSGPGPSLGFEEIQDDSGKGPGIGSSSDLGSGPAPSLGSGGSNNKNLKLDLDLISSSSDNKDLLVNLKQQLNILFTSLNRQFLRWTKFIIPSLLVNLNVSDELILKTLELGNRFNNLYNKLLAYIEVSNTNNFLDNIKSKKVKNKLTIENLNDLMFNSTHNSGFFSTIKFIEKYNKKSNKFKKFKNNIYNDLIDIRNNIEINIIDDIKVLSGIQNDFSTAISVSFLGQIDKTISDSEQDNKEFKNWVPKTFDGQLIDYFFLRNASGPYSYYFIYLMAVFYKDLNKLNSIEEYEFNLIFLNKLASENYVIYLRG